MNTKNTLEKLKIFVISLPIYLFLLSIIIGATISTYHGFTSGWTGDSGESAYGLIGLYYSIYVSPILALLTAIFEKQTKKIIYLLLTLVLISIIALALSFKYSEIKINKENEVLEKEFKAYEKYVDLSYLDSSEFRIDEKKLYSLNKNKNKFILECYNSTNINEETNNLEVFKIKEGYILVDLNENNTGKKAYYFTETIDTEKERYKFNNLNYEKLLIAKEYEKEETVKFNESDKSITKYNFTGNKFVLEQSFTEASIYRELYKDFYLKITTVDIKEDVKKAYPNASNYHYSTYYVEVTNNEVKTKVRATLDKNLDISIIPITD